MNASHINFIPHHEPLPHTEPKRPKWRFFLIVIIGLMLVGGCITRSIVGEYAPQDPSQYDPATLEAKKPEGFINRIANLVFSKENTLDGYSDDRINILLFGIGGTGHEGPFLTDTIILASIKPSTGQIAMLSIPRDLGVKIPGHGWKKINNANAFGEVEKTGSGPEFATKVIEDTFDLKVNYYALVDFKAFSEIIDEVGGVSINVENSFSDQMFPTLNYGYQTVEFNRGIQTMNGETALQYVRSRHGNNGEGSDFARAKRQQKVLFALKEKLFSFSTLLNPLKINNIKNSLQNHINTNMQFSDIMAFMQLVKNLNTKEIITTVLDDSPGGYLQNGTSPEGSFILSPKSGNFDDINFLIENIFEKQVPTKNNTPKQAEPKISYTAANVEIQNGTWIAGMAARMKKRLEDKKFSITTIGNSLTRPQTESGIYKITNLDTADLISALQTELHIPVKQKPPTDIQISTTTDILILLGTDIEE